MTILSVDPAAGTLTAFGRTIPCAIGRSGVCPASAKREGDGMTPVGSWPLRTILIRPGHASPAGLRLPWRWIDQADGWSDDPADPAYNRPIRHPHRFSAEHLWRDDGLYDVVVTLEHNDDPPVPYRGSAIFLHIWNEGRATEGCVAVERAELLTLLPLFEPGDRLDIRNGDPPP